MDGIEPPTRIQANPKMAVAVDVTLPLVTYMLRELLRTDGEIEVVESGDYFTPDGYELDAKVDILVTDRLVEATVTASKVCLLVSNPPCGRLLLPAIKQGVRAIVNIEDVGTELVSAMRTLAAGGGFISPSVVGSVLSWFGSRLPADLDKDLFGRIEKLSAREREVLRLVGEGRSNADMAALLNLSMATVRSHVSHILAKLRVASRLEAVVLGQYVDLLL